MASGLNHLTLTVSNLDRALTFYTQVLGFKPHARWDNGAYLSQDSLWLCLSKGTSQPAKDYSHIALSVTAEGFELQCNKLRLANAPQWQDNSSEGQSYYFLDPDGHKLEIHVGDLQSRLQSLRTASYAGLQWL
ncbi:fosfomycin resistance glutathione transferase [Aestuariibacter halophilus]|uniref:Fosfomycin resistance glutathione transferase n=1 Tax=Fluctibacter halophilus TaxID=226011 RepID=A0ABS8GB91_9ALTE|nr:fosfomycin resistance glutathione transferase [Aestuariibacter halophilus]MCC2616486.1 fosfomycin resistance glutathione transferase [Aestuariibacter halophilus]